MAPRSSNSHHFDLGVATESFVYSEVDEEKLRAIVERVAGWLCFPTLNDYQPFGQLVSGSGFDKVGRIEIADGLAKYQGKKYRSFGPVRDALNIGVFGMNGIEGLRTVSKLKRYKRICVQVG